MSEIIKLFNYTLVPKRNNFLGQQINLFSFEFKENEKVFLSLYLDNVLEVTVVNKTNNHIIDVFDTGTNIANVFQTREVKKSELIDYAKEHLNQLPKRTLLLSEKEFEEMEINFIEKGYSNPIRNETFIDQLFRRSDVNQPHFDVIFDDFGTKKDITLKNDTFFLIIENNYESFFGFDRYALDREYEKAFRNAESILTTFILDGYDKKYKIEFKFKSIDEIYRKLLFYKSFLSKENGTMQAIDWIINLIDEKKFPY